MKVASMTIKRKTLLLTSAVTLALFIAASLKINFNIKGQFEGIYLLHEKEKGKYEFADHLFVGEGKRLIKAYEFKAAYSEPLRRLLSKHDSLTPYLEWEWNPVDGSGFINNIYPGGQRLVTFFGRYLDDDQEVHGLFVGGGLPSTVLQNDNYNMNRSGMTYFDGKRWYHIWCSVNEGIGSARSEKIATPSKWKFLGSKVISKSEKSVVITSSHSIIVDGSPLLIERTARFAAGEPYFSLEIRILNTGTVPVNYQYAYGDEPWVGYYGTSLGDVGWVNDRLITHEEFIDSSKYTYAGVADLGNRVIGEQPKYTNLANFIEWFGPERPSAYFSNGPAILPRKGLSVPLESNERFLGLQWQNGLLPGRSATIQLAIGMAGYDPKSGLPVKPPIRPL